MVTGLTELPLVLKGVRVAEDARRAVESGIDGILVSTHGGRRFDGDMSSIEVVPEVVAATQGKAEVYVDSGIRRGTDVLKALALALPLWRSADRCSGSGRKRRTRRASHA